MHDAARLLSNLPFPPLPLFFWIYQRHLCNVYNLGDRAERPCGERKDHFRQPNREQ